MPAYATKCTFPKHALLRMATALETSNRQGGQRARPSRPRTRLVLFSTIVFAVGNFAPLEVIQRLKLGPRGALVAHFIISIYGGYFGGGIGFLMLAALTLFGMRDINAMNGLKMALVGVMTFTSIVVFVVADVVRWAEVLPMMVSSVVGGYAAARSARSLDQRPIGVHRRDRRRADGLFLLARSVDRPLGRGLTASNECETGWPAAQRDSIRRLRPTVQPDHSSP